MIDLDGLRKTFGRNDVVRSLSFRIRTGEIVALLGPSGCGKTTTLRMIAGLTRPDEGTVSIAGRVMTGVPVERRNVGILFQNYALFPHMTVRANVMFGLRAWQRRTPRREAGAMVAEALRLVRLEGFEQRYPAQLSGGQQQRVALARALVVKPSVLLLDEPLAALDKGLRTAMQGELRSLVRRLGLTTVLVTHDQEEAMTVADRIAVMDRGTIVQVGTAAELYEHPHTVFAASFIGAANLITGTLRRFDDGRTGLVTSSGMMLSVDAPPGRLDGPGSVAVRPERIGLASGQSAGRENAASGVVEAVTYKGSIRETAIRLHDGTMLTSVALNTNAVSHGAGDVVTATWSGDANVLLED